MRTIRKKFAGICEETPCIFDNDSSRLLAAGWFLIVGHAVVETTRGLESPFNLSMV